MLLKLVKYLLRNNEDYKKLDALLDRKDEWKYDTFTMTHKSGLVLWVANGMWFIKVIEPVRHDDFSTLVRYALWEKIKPVVYKKSLSEFLKTIE